MQRHGVTFDLAAVTLSLKILSGQYLRNFKSKEVGRDIG